MNYDILKPFSPIMPQLGKGTECISLILSQVSPDMREVVTPMLFPALGAYMSGVEFQYPDLTWKEPCGMLAHLIADSGMGKGQLTSCIEAIMRKFRKHDDDEMQKLVEWQRQVKSKGANKEKPIRPDVAFWFPPSDIDILNSLQPFGTTFHMYPDCDAPGERLFLQLRALLPNLTHHQLPAGCKDFSDYYRTTKGGKA